MQSLPRFSSSHWRSASGLVVSHRDTEMRPSLGMTWGRGGVAKDTKLWAGDLGLVVAAAASQGEYSRPL
jgi:hypothetical protein